MDPMTQSRVGRRSGDTNTRQALLDAASRMFAEHGYEGASLRAIARDAGVDPGMVRHFFGNKNALFLATLVAGTEIQDALTNALVGDVESIGQRAVDAVLTLWEEEPTATTLRALFRSAASSSDGVPGFAEIMAPRVFGTLGVEPDPRVMTLAALAGSQMLGVAIGRYVLKIGPLAAMSREELVAQVGPSIQLHLERLVRLASAERQATEAASGATR
jgi:AcrR family transcriptional regulator